jgi:glycerate 2-kinase
VRPALQKIYWAAVDAAQGSRLLGEFAAVNGTTWQYQGPGLDIELELPTAGGRLFVVGAGKPAAAMAQGLEKSLGDYIHRGLVITKYGHGTPLKHIDVLEAGHPLPDKAGVHATQQLIELLGDVTAKDKVVVLLGGGASALLVAPTL